MKEIYVKDVMVPISQYASVSEKASVLDAIRVLESEENKSPEGTYRDRAVLVVNADGEVIGKVSQVDIIRGIEPNYQNIGTDLDLTRLGFSNPFLRSLQDHYKLWERPIEELCRLVNRLKVVDVMYKATDLQHVRGKDTLSTAMHQIIMGRHQSLLVTKGKRVIGILKSTDVFSALCGLLKECRTF